MKRDMDLVREILISVEKAEFGGLVANDLVTAERDKRHIASHFQLLSEAGLVEANLLTIEGAGVVDGTIERLTWSGHEFLDATRNNTIWQKTKSIIGTSVGTTSLDIMKQVATKLTLGQLGIGS